MEPFSRGSPNCPITYECVVVSGPRTDICSLVDGSTSGQFDPSTGSYRFVSTDSANFPPGDYIFMVSVAPGIPYYDYSQSEQEIFVTFIEPASCDDGVVTASKQEQTSYTATYDSPNNVIAFKMVPFTVSVADCPVVYSCELLVPQNFGIDLCASYQDATGSSWSNFNPTTGDLTFSTTDSQTFPPGTYAFLITGQSGTSPETGVTEVVIRLLQNDPCTAVVDVTTTQQTN